MRFSLFLSIVSFLRNLEHPGSGRKEREFLIAWMIFSLKEACMESCPFDKVISLHQVDVVGKLIRFAYLDSSLLTST